MFVVSVVMVFVTMSTCTVYSVMAMLSPMVDRMRKRNFLVFRTVLVVVFCMFVVVVASSPACSVSLFSVVSILVTVVTNSSTRVLVRACSPERSAVSADKATSDFFVVVIL